MTPNDFLTLHLRDAKFGHFEGALADGVDLDLMPIAGIVTVREEYTYVEPDGTRWPVMAGLVCDGTSFPRPLWSIAHPLSAPYVFAALPHDTAYRVQNREKREADRAFYRALRRLGVPFHRAKAMHYAVRWFGRYDAGKRLEDAR